MSKSSFFFLTLVALTLVVLPVQSFGEETTTEPSPTVSTTTNADKNTQFMKARQEMEQRRKDALEEKKTVREQEREALKEKIKMKRQETEEKMKTEREAFKTKISELKNARKKMIMENLDTKLSSWNKLRTDQFVAVLEKLTLIVDRVEERTSKMKTEGKNTSGAEAAIATARTAIVTATTAVEAQAGKSYVITVTDETTLKENSKTTVQTLHTDIKATGEKVKAAREAVQAIFHELVI